MDGFCLRKTRSKCLLGHPKSTDYRNCNDTFLEEKINFRFNFTKNRNWRETAAEAISCIGNNANLWDVFDWSVTFFSANLDGITVFPWKDIFCHIRTKVFVFPQCIFQCHTFDTRHVNLYWDAHLLSFWDEKLWRCCHLAEGTNVWTSTFAAPLSETLKTCQAFPQKLQIAEAAMRKNNETRIWPRENFFSELSVRKTFFFYITSFLHPVQSFCRMKELL